MKYCIEWDYNDNHLDWKMKIQEADQSDFKGFIIYWMPWLIQDLFERFWKNLKDQAKKENISYDKVIWVVSLMSIMCLNNLSDKLTSSLDEFLADDPDQDSEEEVEEGSVEINWNNWSSILWNNQEE